MDIYLKSAITIVLLCLNLIIFHYRGTAGHPFAMLMNIARGAVLGFIAVRIWEM